MERDKDEGLTAKEIEEAEQMKRELTGMGMYESGYTYNHMKAILGAISESKDMAQMSVDNKHEQKESLNSSNDQAMNALREINSAHGSQTPDYSELQEFLKWRMNPFDACVDKNDVPLQKLNRRPVRERVPFRYCKDTQISGKCEKIMMDLSAHLKEMADLWCNRHSSTDPKFQWGSPIQVGTSAQTMTYRSYR